MKLESEIARQKDREPERETELEDRVAERE